MNRKPVTCRRALLAGLMVGIMLFGLAVAARAYPSYAPNPAMVKAAPYDSASSGTGNWGLGTTNTSRDFLTLGQRYRVRQNGAIRRIRLYTATTNRLTGFYLTVWRKDGASFDLVGKSANLRNALVTNSIATIDLDTPIDAREGDYYGYRMEGLTNYSTIWCFFARTSQTGVTTYYANSTTVPDTDYIWTNAPNLNIAGAVLAVELYMTAPQAVFIGDSIAAGHPAHYSFLETTATTAIDSTIEKQFANLTGYTYQNMGIGSQTTTAIAARFTNDVLDLKPRLVVLEGGVNDIATGGTKATFLANMAALLGAAQANSNISAVAVLKILPWTNGSNAQMQTRDDWNNALAALAAGYSKAFLVDASALVGQFRAGGDPGNRWDIQPAYNADGVHFNQAGHAQIARAIANALPSGTLIVVR